MKRTMDTTAYTSLDITMDVAECTMSDGEEFTSTFPLCSRGAKSMRTAYEQPVTHEQYDRGYHEIASERATEWRLEDERPLKGRRQE